MNAPRLHAAQRQQQTITPRLQHAVRLLQLSAQDFVLEVNQAIGRNPFLDAEDDAVTDDPELAEADVAEAANHDAGDAMDDGDAADPHEATDAWTLGPGPNGHLSAGESAEDSRDWIAAATSLSDHLHVQLNVLRLPWRELTLARAVIESLDEDGYLRCTLSEAVQSLELDPVPESDELQIALRRVQALEPAGVGARSVAECLLLQLSQQPDHGCSSDGLAARIVQEHLGDLATRNMEKLGRLLGADAAAVLQACDRIRALDPRPGWRFGGSDTQYIVPDVIVRKRGKQWVPALNPRIVPRVRLNETYADLFHRHRTPAHGEMAAQLQDARWTLHNVQQRFSTILLVAQAIIDRQGQFFDYGPMAMKPMALREIADAVGVHPSTVCRVTNNKYMATPAGVFELKYFFSRALPTSAGGSCSATALKSLIGDMIAAEDAERPLSDAQIARDLGAQGLQIVRRTVTKYRQTMAIDAAGVRRRQA